MASNGTSSAQQRAAQIVHMSRQDLLKNATDKVSAREASRGGKAAFAFADCIDGKLADLDQKPCSQSIKQDIQAQMYAERPGG